MRTTGLTTFAAVALTAGGLFVAAPSTAAAPTPTAACSAALAAFEAECEGEELVDTFEAASGTGDTPTPLGTFYLVELLRPTNGGYGPYAYGLSGFSEVLDDFGGGPGQIWLHGTDDPDSIGRAVSHGCIRLSDEDITLLAETLPLGTPVVITWGLRRISRCGPRGPAERERSGVPRAGFEPATYRLGGGCSIH